jgi:glycosyltransferase involved in cell wall biosynthesis
MKLQVNNVKYKMKEPLFSIIIPVWNAEKTLADCLNSVIQQKFQSFETIIVDGISTDGTIEIVKSYAASHHNIEWISEKDNGIFDAMNKGINAARGEWVYFLGSDDALINEDVLALVADSIQEGDEIIYGNSIWIPANFEDSGPKSYIGLLKEGINHQRIFYKTSLFQKFGFYNIHYKFASDFELNKRFFCNPAIHKKYVNIPIANFHSGGISSQYIDEELWKNWKTIILKNLRPYVSKKQIYRRLSWYCWYMMQKKKYRESFSLFCAIYFHTFSFTFLRHTISQVLKISRQKIK